MKDFDKIIWRDAVTLADFFATWCGPCQAMVPVIDRFQTEMNGRADVYRIDVDDRRGEVLWRRSGLIGYRELREAFDTIEQREHAVHH